MVRLRPRGAALRRVGRGAPVEAAAEAAAADIRTTISASRGGARVRAFTLKGIGDGWLTKCRQIFRCLTVRLCGECTGTLSLISPMSNYPLPFSQTASVIWL